MIPKKEGKLRCLKNRNNDMKEGLVMEEWELTNNCRAIKYCNYVQDSPYGFSKFITMNVEDNSIKESFEGELVDNKADGYGIYNDINGEYEGDWSNDSQYGIGIERTPDNSIYSGEFKNGLKHGVGVYTWADGTTYAGEWADNMFHGYGIYKFANGKIYRGQFQNGIMEGYGELLWLKGDAYFGGISKSKKSGFGIYTINKNKKKFVYIGFFGEDKMNGYGKLMNNECEQYGIWNMGKLEKKLELYEFNNKLKNNGLEEYLGKFSLNYSGFVGYYSLCLKE